MAQTSYAQYGAPGMPGMIDGVGPRNVRSYAAEDVIPAGRAVKLGTDPEKNVSWADSADSTIGFAAIDPVQTCGAGYSVGDTVPVMTQGRIWVETDDAVEAGATANLKVSGGKLTDEAPGTGIEAFTKINVVFITATSGPGLAIVEVK